MKIEITGGTDYNLSVQAEIFDINGGLVSMTGKDAYPYIWQPSPSVPSGVYLVRASAGNEVITKKVIYLK